MTYKLDFLPLALKEWERLDNTVKSVLKKALKKRLERPKVESQKLYGDLQDCYKIKLRTIGYRLVYKVYDDRLVVLVLAIGKRDRRQVYDKASERRELMHETE